jgi:hypothetical protein
MGKNMAGIESRVGFAQPELYTSEKLVEGDKQLSEFRLTNINEYLI